MIEITKQPATRLNCEGSLSALFSYHFVGILRPLTGKKTRVFAPRKTFNKQ
jgi:hypothetical protein